MKKAMCTLLALVMSMSFVSCSQKSGSSQVNSADTISSSSTAVSTETADESRTTSSAADSLYKADQSYLPGLCYIAYDAAKWKGVDYKKSLKMMSNLGVKSWRCWFHFDWLMKDPKTFDKDGRALMKDILNESKQYHFQIIGMCQGWFNGTGDNLAMPSRDMKEGSAYTKILLSYEESWYNLVKQFPEIEYWEIGNEWNNDGFLHPLDYNTTGNVFSNADKAKITLDMLYYASRGIHRANPNARTIIGGLCDVNGFHNGRIKIFYEKLYEDIESGDWPSLNPDDYFQAAAWHPYEFGKDVSQQWVDDNLAIYNVIKENEKHDKKVFLTEMGWEDLHDNSAIQEHAQWITEAYNYVKKDMPFVESMYYFRLLDEKDDSGWGGKKEASFGLFTAPANGFSPKATAYAFQKIAGGKGNLKEFATK